MAQLEQPASGPATMAESVVASRYRRHSTLGAGHAHRLYLADDLHVEGRRVVLKMACAAGVQTLLANEAWALARVCHPALPQLLDVLPEGESHTLVLGYLPGCSLAAQADAIPYDEAQVLEWGLRLCDVLAHLHGPRCAITHGAVRAEHCLVGPSGQLALIDFSAAAPATDEGCRRDARAVALLLYHLLGGVMVGNSLPPVRVFNAQVSAATDEMLHAALAGGANTGLLTVATLRRQILDCCRLTGLSWQLCPYCQAAARPAARHCGACGSALWREGAAPASQGTAAAPSTPASTVVSTSAAVSAASPGGEASPTANRATGRLIARYTDRLRAIGHYLDTQGLRRVTVVDSTTHILVRAQTTGGGRLSAVTPGSVVALLVAVQELEEWCALAVERRGQPQPMGQRRASVLDSGLFPGGYEDRLRALGAELDALHGVAQIALIEASDQLHVEYDHIGADQASRGSHAHLALSRPHLDRILAAATGRRGGTRPGSLLQAVRQRERQRAAEGGQPV